MEFPTLGEHCEHKDCNLTDFLPLHCKCGKVFCRLHFLGHCQSSECSLAPPQREVNLNNDDTIFKCSEKGCRKGNLHELLCKKCNKHYCIEHRFHPSCPEIDDDTMAAKIEEFSAPRRQFQEANKNLQAKITENIRKALQSTAKVKTASKLHLMRIKQKAVGPKAIPPTDRIYFAIVKPKDSEPKAVKTINDTSSLLFIESITIEPDLKDTIPVFISSKWSLGKALDIICDLCNIKNENAKMTDMKLRLFRQLDGYCISPVSMDVQIEELMKQNVLLDGDRLLVDYIDSKVLSNLNANSQIFLSKKL